MNYREALDILNWIPDDKVKPEHRCRLSQINFRARNGFNPDPKESALIQEIYRYTNGGGDKESQPFKQYRRPTSRGI